MGRSLATAVATAAALFASLGTAPAQAICTVVPLAVLPVTMFKEIPVVTVVIDGTPMRFVLDTGAKWTAITPRGADALHLVPDHGNMSESHGISGTPDKVSWNYDAHTKTIAIGDLVLTHRSLHVARLLNGTDEIAGIIGADILGAHDVDLDLPLKVIRLYDPKGCVGDFVDWPGRHDHIGEAWTPGNQAQLQIPTTLGSTSLRTAVDTGASESMIARRAAVASGADDDALFRSTGAETVDATGTPIPTRMFSFRRLRIGGEQFSNIDLKVCDCEIPNADFQIGEDYLASREVWLSYTTGQIFIRRHG
jgi:predicted aspartyl protease